MPRLVLLAALLLAGCAASPGETERGPQDPVPAEFELGACAIQEIIAGVAPESLAAFLPGGFVAEPFPAEGRSGLIALTTLCSAPEPTRLGLVIIPIVSAPDGLARDGASAQGIITSVVVDEGETTWDALQAWGYGPVLARGRVVAEGVAPPPADALARAGDAAVEREGGGRFALGTLVRGAPRTDDGNFLRFFMVHEREVIGIWDCDLTGDHRVFSGEAHLQASGYAPLPGEPTAGLGFHELTDSFRWTRVAWPPEQT